MRSAFCLTNAAGAARAARRALRGNASPLLPFRLVCFIFRAVNCCAEVVAILDSGPDGGNCAAPADCRGFTGNCADIVYQFAALPVLPDFPNGLADYTCSAFPDDNNPVDSFIVGLSAFVRSSHANLIVSDSRLRFSSLHCHRAARQPVPGIMLRDCK